MCGVLGLIVSHFVSGMEQKKEKAKVTKAEDRQVETLTRLSKHARAFRQAQQKRMQAEAPIAAPKMK